jgi:hypothetical protein
METIQPQNMNISNGSLSSSKSLSSNEEMIAHSTSLATIDVSADERVNMIEADDISENCTRSASAMELTPYPYTPTSEELTDYYQLEQSLGEDWSYRLACELSCDAVSMDDDDDWKCSNDDSVTFFDDSDHHDSANLTATLPEDIEVRAYTRRETCFDDNVTPFEPFANYESF